ncbi:unnamed protein product [Thlaspi arvense]|uniref:non-specific serine/threonine protein kinase n=1 Tax=Thlaspi arvense TaxID=13288 RepID=A0AAU9SI86_THLAR|nr:unnamed protein product [Thlaspi arvense]
MTVEALKKIGKKLKKQDWDFGEDPCSGYGNWSVLTNPLIRSSVICDCQQSSLSCHVIEIVLTSQNLTGIIPPEFSELRYLKSLILDRNCLTGSIPKEWGYMHLEELSFLGNRLSGSFPEVLTRITSLRVLNLEGNQFSGPVSREIGKLVYLDELYLSSNSFTGPLPEQFGQLKNLTHLRISDNNFTGRIPDFIGSWRHISWLEMLGSGLDGPLPSSTSSLTSLVNLRISDLGGKLSSFPALKNLKSLQILELRRCNIIGRLPIYIGNMTGLKTLDLSFNLMTGKIPSSLANLKLTDYIYLAGNKFTGSVPSDFIERNKHIDISYNNFTIPSSIPSGDCDKTNNANLVESFFGWNESYKHTPCYFQHFPCLLPKRKHKYKLYINCGGDEVKVDRGKRYEANGDGQRASMFVYGADKHWAFSSSGHFMNDLTEVDDYTVSNTSTLLVDASSPSLMLYKTARISPLLLTYYGLCLGNGQYTVSLHFAEIIFTNDSTFYSLGKRVFDIYVQRCCWWNGQANHKDIRGTHFKPPAHHHKKNILLLVGIIVAVVIIVLVIVVIFLWKRRCDKNAMDRGIVDVWSLNNYANFIAYVLQDSGCLLDLVDPALGSDFSKEEAMVILSVALMCTNTTPALRPIMSQVVSIMEEKTAMKSLSSHGEASTSLNPHENDN